MLNIFKGLLSLGPVFALEEAASLFFFNHHTYYKIHYENSNPIYVWFMAYGLIVPLCKVLCIPVWQYLFQPLLSRYYPNMFKRMGVALIFL